MSTKTRGFASMNKEKRQLIASLGGKTAHAKGTAHTFTREEARLAGKKGGQTPRKVAKRKKVRRKVQARVKVKTVAKTVAAV